MGRSLKIYLNGELSKDAEVLQDFEDRVRLGVAIPTNNLPTLWDQLKQGCEVGELTPFVPLGQEL